MKVDESINKYKARFVIKIYRQKEDIDYYDTYPPILRIASSRMIIAVIVF